MRRGVVLSTCEHLLSAFRGSGIDNCFVELDNIEVPILDGSSENWVELLEKAGVKQQTSPRRTLRVLECRCHYRKKLAADMSIEPSDKFEIDCVIDFPHPFINRQTFHFVIENGSFGKQIASARTFGFTHEIDMLPQGEPCTGRLAG